NQSRIDIPSITLAIDNDRNGADAHDGGSTGNDRKTWNNDLVTWPDMKSCKSDFDRDAAIADGYPVRAAHQFREPGFKLPDERPFRGNPPRLDALDQVFLLIAIKQRAVNWNHARLLELKLWGEDGFEPRLVCIA